MSGRALKLGGVLRWVLDAAWYLLLVGGGLAMLGFIVFLSLGGHVRADVPVAFHMQPGASLTGSGRSVTLTDLSGTLRTRASSLAAAAIIGLTIVAADLVRAVAYLSGELWARTHVHLSRISFPITFPVQVTVLVAGLLVIVLAEVFRIGYALQQDQDLTI